MRIISGRAKGMRLFTPPAKSMSIRPTSDKCREALFSILAHHLKDSSVLDLYAGTGSLGLEALSRGGKSALFVDNSNISLTLLKKNISAFQNCLHPDGKNISVLKCDLNRGLNSIMQRIASVKFNLIFLDPPYDKGLSLNTLTNLDKSEILEKDGLIIAEERIKTNLPEAFRNLTLYDKRRYGDTGFWIYAHKTQNQDNLPD